MIATFTIFIGITVYLICYSRSLINNIIYCIKFNDRKKNKNMMNAII